MLNVRMEKQHRIHPEVETAVNIRTRVRSPFLAILIAVTACDAGPTEPVVIDHAVDMAVVNDSLGLGAKPSQVHMDPFIDCLPSVRGVVGSAVSARVNRITWQKTSQNAGCKFGKYLITWWDSTAVPHTSAPYEFQISVEDSIFSWDHELYNGRHRSTMTYEVMVKAEGACSWVCNGPSSTVTIANTLDHSKRIPWIQFSVSESSNYSKLWTPDSTTVRRVYIAGDLEWAKSTYAHSQDTLLAYEVQESVGGGAWRSLAPYTVSTAAGIDSIYQTPRAEDYTYGAIVAGTNDLAAKLTGIARMTNNTEYRFRVRHPGEEWSESASFRTPTYASDRDPRPDEPTEPPVVLLTNFDCEPTLDSYCRPPIAPQFVDIIYAPGSVEIVWEIMEHGGGQDHNGRAIPVARVSIVNDRWAACPFGSFQVAQSARPNFETCDGRGAGSGRKFIGSFTESIQAWLVEFRAQARNPNRGQYIARGSKHSASHSEENYMTGMVISF